MLDSGSPSSPGSPIPHAVLCVTKQQKPLITSLSTVSLQGNTYRFLSLVGLQSLSPQSTEISFYDWWERVSNGASGLILQGLNSLIILGAWTLWTQRNRCVFDGGAPHMDDALIISSEERKLWALAGARGISFLTGIVS